MNKQLWYANRTGGKSKMIRATLVDKEIKPFSVWLKELKKEDKSEYLGEVFRPEKELSAMYRRYREFQSSKEVRAIRDSLI